MAESLFKLGSMLESARELTLEAANSASARLIDDFPPQSKDITNMLNGRTERERLSGLKHVVGIMAAGKNAVEYFPDVIKNIASSNLEVRRLVYIFLLRYAEFEPDLALLSINTIQKSLSDKSVVIRSLAIRVIAAIKIPVLSPIVILSIKKACRDLSPTVRKASVQAIASCFDLDPSSGPALLEMIEHLLTDVDPSVRGAALSVLAIYWPDRLDMVHKVFRGTCRILPQLDEWNQIFITELLTRYGRMFLAKPKGAIGDIDTKNDKVDNQTFNGPQQEKSKNDIDSFFAHNDTTCIDPDLQLLIDAVNLLLFSRNGAVVLAVAKLYYYLGTTDLFHSHNVAEPLVRLLRGDYSMQYVVLVNIRNFCLTLPAEFRPFSTYFYLSPNDPFHVSKLKLEILSLLNDASFSDEILSELRYYATTFLDRKLVSECMKAIVRCSIISESNGKRTLKWLLKMVQSDNPLLVSESLTAIRLLIQRDIKSHISTAARLAMCLDSVTTSDARASIICLVGEFSPIAYKMAPDVLRLCAKTFVDEEESVRYQIVVLAAKVYACQLSRKREGVDSDPDVAVADDVVKKLFDYVMNLARYDSSYDIRDRTRMFTSLLNSSINSDIGLLLLQASKPIPMISLREQLFPSDSKFHIKAGGLVFGTSSAVLGYPLDGYQSMIDWTPKCDLLTPSVRAEEIMPQDPEPLSLSNKQYSTSSKQHNQETEDKHGLVSSSNIRQFKDQTLDEFFGEPAAQKEDLESSSESGVEETSEEDDSDSDDYDDNDESDDELNYEEEDEEEEDDQDEDENENEDNTNESSKLIN